MQIKEVLKWAHEQLILTSDSARLDVELLLSHVIERPVTFLLAHDEHNICSMDWWKYKRMINKRKKGMPVAYLIGHKEFYMLDFIVNRSVLVPRPDTEILVDCVISYLKTQNSKLKIQSKSKIHPSKFTHQNSPILLDIGTGSACIPISVLKNVEGIKAVAIDVSRGALRVARKNIKKHKLKSRIQLLKSDLLEDVPVELFEGREVIVTANLPYIPTDYQISEELKYEPQISLFGGGDGMELYKKIVQQLADIKPRAIFFELFEDQIAILKTKLPDYKLKYVENMSGKARCLCMERI